MPAARSLVEMVNGVPVLAAPKEIDIANADGFRVTLLESAVRGPGTLVVDMARTRFCDTAGLHALVSARKRALAAGGDLLLVRADAPVWRIFAITGLDQVFSSFTTLEEALAQIPAVASGTPRDGVSRA